MTPSRARHAAVVVLLTVFLGSPLFANWDEGVAAFQAGRFQDAATKFHSVVDESPEFPAGYYMLGLSLLRQKQVDGALQHLAKAVELGPDDPRYRLTYAQAQIQGRKWDGALATLASLEPSKVPAANRKAYAQLVAQAATRSKNHDVALKALEKTISLDRSSKTLWLAVAHVAQKANRSQKSFSALTTAYDLDRKDDDLGRRAVHTAFAQAQKQNGDARQDWYGKGFDMARKWAERSRSSEAYLLAGQAQMGLKDYATAGTWFAKAAGADAGSPQAHYEQARCALALKEADAALTHLGAARERSPDADLTRQIYLAEGFAYRIREEFTKAADVFRKAGDEAKVAEMVELQERKDNNKLFEQEKRECKLKVAEIKKLKVEMVDLKGTDAWEQLESDEKAIVSACAAHLKDG